MHAARLGVVAVLAAAASLVSPSVVPAQDAPSAGLPGARVAIVVDESGSLTPEGVEQERLAAVSLSSADPSAETQVGIIGFGSSNRDGQSATQTYCGLTPTSEPEDKTNLERCAQQVHQRLPAEGNDTDFVAATQAGVDMVRGGPPGTPRLVFFLTDGQLDVPNSPQFGVVPGERNAEALRQLTQVVLPDARAAGVQIWPLGFGAADLQSMARLASGGFGPNPACPSAGAPRADLASAGDVQRIALRAFAAARCGGPVEDETPIGSGGTGEIALVIPPVATDVSIAVTKPDPNVVVEYIDPRGRPAPLSGSRDGSTFSAGGAGRRVESLRVTNPEPGRWTVRLKAPAGSTAGPARGTAVWTGAVHASLQVSPPAPAARSDATAYVRVLTRKGAVLDAAGIAGLAAGLNVSGNGFEPFSVALHDDGRPPDTAARDGVFSGTFTMPAGASGPASIVGVIDAPGLTSDARPYSFKVPLDGVPVASAELQVPSPARLHRGDHVDAVVSVTNPGTAPLAASVSLEEISEGGLVTSEPSGWLAAPGRTSAAVRLQVGDATAFGPLTFNVVVRDGDRILGSSFFVSEVVDYPSWPESHWRQLALALLVAGAAAAGLVLWLRSRGPKPVAGLFAKLLSEDGTLAGAAVPAPARGTTMRVVVDDDAMTPHLRRARGEEAGVEIRWARSGRIRIATLDGAAEVLPGTPVWLDPAQRMRLLVDRTQGQPSSQVPTAIRLTPPKAPLPQEDDEAVADERQPDQSDAEPDDAFRDMFR